MSDKDAAKRRRQARNRQERMSRQKRIEGARRAEAARRTEGSGRPSRSAAAAADSGKASGGLLSKVFPPKPTPPADGDAAPSRTTGGKGSTGDAPARPTRGQPMVSPVVEIDEEATDGVRAAIGRRLVQPGGRAVLLAFAFTIMLGIALVAVPLVPRTAFEAYGRILIEDAPVSESVRDAQLRAFEDGDEIDLGTVRFAQVVPPLVLGAFALAPLLIAGVALRSLTRPTRSRTLLFSAMGMGMIVFFAPSLMPFAAPALIALGFGAYQSRKADVPATAPA